MSKAHCFSLFLLLCLPAFASAQQPASPAGAPAHTEPASSPAPRNGEGRIQLDVVVTDKPGKPVSGLELKDFTLLDDGQPRKILSFHAAGGEVQGAPPVEVILLIDTINLTFEQVAEVRQAMARFLLRNGGYLAQPASLIVVSDQGVSFQPEPSLDGNAMAAAVNQLNSGLRTHDSTSESDEVDRHVLSINMLTTIVKREAAKPGRKLLIWAGRGWPTLDSSQMDLSRKEQQREFQSIVDLSTWLREARIALYSISAGAPGTSGFFYEGYLKGVKSAGKAGPPNLGLEVLAIQSGGRVLGPDNDLEAQIEDCVQDAGAFYTLSFDPPNADKPNEYHDLTVQSGRPGLKARTSTGYYNQP
jgi:VWFA-related protein